MHGYGYRTPTEILLRERQSIAKNLEAVKLAHQSAVRSAESLAGEVAYFRTLLDSFDTAIAAIEPEPEIDQVNCA